MISYDDFKKLELKVAKILEVKDIPQADKLYVLTIDLGDEKRNIVAGIKQFYKPDELTGKNIVVVNNLEPAVIRGIESSAMLLAASAGEQLSIITLDRDIAPGTAIK